VTKWFLAVQKFEEDDTDGPNIDFRSNLRVILLEALGSLIPVRSYTLRCELNFVLALVKRLTQAKVSDFDLPIVEYDILRLQVIMDDLMLLVI